jgi:hypothetical protein
VASKVVDGMTRRVQVFDAAGLRVAEVGQLEALSAQPRWREPGGWSLMVPPGAAADALTLAGAQVVIEADGVPVMSGPVTAVSYGPEGTAMVTGRGDMWWLGQRLALTGSGSPYPKTVDYTGVAETVIRSIVDANAGPSAVEARRLLTFGAADQTRGTSGTWKAANQPMLNLLLDIVNGEGWGLQVIREGGNRVFRLLVPVDLSASVRLHEKLGAISGWTRTRTVPEASYVYAAGTESAGARPVVEGGNVNDWGRIERWHDVGNTAVTGELETLRDAELLDKAEVDELVVTLSPVGPFQFGVDYGLGDTVSVQAGDVRRLDTVVGVDIDLETITPVLSGGRVLPALPSLRRLTDLERRVAALETN